MTVKEYWKKNKPEKERAYGIEDFEFAEEFTCWINYGKVWIEEYFEGAFTLEHIKTMEQFYQLKKLLTGE